MYVFHFWADWSVMAGLKNFINFGGFIQYFTGKTSTKLEFPIVASAIKSWLANFGLKMYFLGSK